MLSGAYRRFPERYGRSRKKCKEGYGKKNDQRNAENFHESYFDVRPLIISRRQNFYDDIVSRGEMNLARSSDYCEPAYDVVREDGEPLLILYVARHRA